MLVLQWSEVCMSKSRISRLYRDSAADVPVLSGAGEVCKSKSRISRLYPDSAAEVPVLPGAGMSGDFRERAIGQDHSRLVRLAFNA